MYQRSASVVDGMPMAPSNQFPGKRGRRFSCPSVTPVENAVMIKRPPYTQVAFDEIHRKTTDDDEKRWTSVCKDQLYCSKKRIWKVVSTFLPFIKVLRYYKLKDNILIDVLSGITIGVMHIPQALAFGMLTSVKVENGLYTSIWPILLYVIFGTSPHVSMGTSAVICIVTASIVDRQADIFKLQNPHLINTTALMNVTEPIWEDIPEFMDYKEGVALSIALISGLMLLIMGFLRLGFVTAYLSESFFNAFTSGAAVHIATSQVPALLGLHVPRFGGVFKLIYTYSSIIGHITQVNYATIVIAVISIVLLSVVKECINERYKSKLLVPVPIELIVVILATVISYFTDIHGAFEVDIVGSIPTGIPGPIVPPMTGVGDYLVDCFIISILIFANTIAMAKICAKKHNYEVDDSQELIAYGMCNFASSFMKCFPSAVAPPRSMVASSMNTKTTFSGILSATLMILLVVVLGAIFEPLPKAALAAVIVVALKGLFIQFKDSIKFWRINKFDFVIWLCTILGVVFLDIDIGLGIGVGVSLITVVFQTQFARGYRAARTMKDSAIIEHRKYNDSMEVSGVKIFRYHSNLYFANAEIFRSTLYRSTVNPRKLLKMLKKQERKANKEAQELKKKLSKSKAIDSVSIDIATDIGNMKSNGSLPILNENVNNSNATNGSTVDKGALDNPMFTESPETSKQSGLLVSTKGFTKEFFKRQMSCDSLGTVQTEDEDPEDGEEYVNDAKIKKMRRTHHVIVDCSTINYLDASGANVLGHISTEYEHVNIKLLLAGCSDDILETMKHARVFDKITENDIFLDVHDALAVAKTKGILPLPMSITDYSDDEAAEDSYVTKM